MALKWVLAALLLLQVATALEEHVFKYLRTTTMFAECERKLYTFLAEPFQFSSPLISAKRFAPAKVRSVKWTEIPLKDPKSIYTCVKRELDINGGSATMMRFRSNRCFRTEDPAYVVGTDDENCSENPSEIVYLLGFPP